MTAIIDVAGGSVPARSGGGRAMEETRQARWLFDLEQALFEQGLKPYQAVQAQEPGAGTGQGMAARSEAEAVALPLPDTTAAAAAPQASPVAKQSDSSAVAVDQYAPSAAQAVATDVTLSNDPQTAAAGLFKGAGGHSMAVAVPKDLPPSAAGGPAPPVGLAQPTPWGAGPLPSLRPAANAQIDTADAPVALRAAAPSGRPLAFLAAGSVLASPNGSEQTESMARAAPVETTGEPFEKKLLHLFYGRDGVHAWVRDAELQAEQMRSLAQNLAGELAGERQRLASLTVNGKKVTAALAVASRDDSALAAPKTPDGNTIRSNK